MTVTDWLRRAKLQMAVFGPQGGTRAAGMALWQGLAQRAGPHLDDTDAPTVWDRDWDVLILLDACRPDALETLKHEYQFLPGEIESTQSPASCSRSWIDEHFSTDNAAEVANTAYITGNVWSRDFGTGGLADGDEFGALSEVWRDNWDDHIGTVPPGAITDQAIRTWRSENFDRMIVHYMQPHEPYRSLDDASGFDDPEDPNSEHRLTVWDHLRAGDLSIRDARRAYRDNLRWALDDVEVFLANCDAENAVISADHAELFGKYGLYSHPDIPIDELRCVPWQPVPSMDSETYYPESESTNPSEITVDGQLKALGYT